MKIIASKKYSENVIKLAKETKPDGLEEKSDVIDSKLIAEGIAVEMENTYSRAIAKEIAIDNLTADRNYYNKSKKIEG